MRKSIVLSLLLFGTIFALHAQSAESISDIIKTSEATYGQVSYLAGVYQGNVPEDASFEAAFSAYKESGIISSSVTQSDAIPLKDASLLCAHATGLKGGLFYSIFHNARYAFRELKAKKILPPSVDPNMKISGRDAVAILSGCISVTGGNE